MRVGNALYSADPGVGWLSGYARSRTLITRSGVAPVAAMAAGCRLYRIQIARSFYGSPKATVVV